MKISVDLGNTEENKTALLKALTEFVEGKTTVFVNIEAGYLEMFHHEDEPWEVNEESEAPAEDDEATDTSGMVVAFESETGFKAHFQNREHPTRAVCGYSIIPDTKKHFPIGKVCLNCLKFSR